MDKEGLEDTCCDALSDCKIVSKDTGTEGTKSEVLLPQDAKAVIQYLDIPTILPMLQSHRLVTGEEYLHLLTRWEQGLRQTTVGILLEILPRKHPRWTPLFLQALQEEKEHIGHVYLSELLGKTLEVALEVLL